MNTKFIKSIETAINAVSNVNKNHMTSNLYSEEQIGQALQILSTIKTAEECKSLTFLEAVQQYKRELVK